MTKTSHERGAPGDAPRRPAARWRIPLAVVALTTAAGIACVPWVLSSPARMSRVVAGALPDLDGDVTLRKVRMGWMGPIVLEGIRVVPRDGADAPLSVGRIEVGHGLAAILTSFGDLGRVAVRGLEADVVFDDDAGSNLSGLFRTNPRKGGPSAARSRRRSPLRMRLEVEDAVVRITGPKGLEPWRSEPIDVRATLGPAADGGWSEWVVEPVDLLVDARLEPGVAQGMLAYVAPILAGATSTSGRFSLRLDAVRLPVGRPADGTLSGTLAMHEVVVGPGPMVEGLLKALPGRYPAPLDIRVTDESRVAFHLADRRVTHDGLRFGLPLAKPGQRLDVQSSGSVGIDDGSLDLRLQLRLPADRPQNRPVLAALAGTLASIGIRGTLAKPKVVFDGSIQDAVGDVFGDLLDR